MASSSRAASGLTEEGGGLLREAARAAGEAKRDGMQGALVPHMGNGGRRGSSSSSSNMEVGGGSSGSVWKIAQGVCGASFVGLALFLLFLVSIPIAGLFAWLAAPPFFDRSFALVFDFRQTQPSAVISIAPHSPGTPRVFRPGQRYDATLSLRLPESDHNRALSMFQVSAQALSPSGEVLHSVSLPCTLRHRSVFLRAARTAFLVLPLLCGLIDEHQLLTIPLLTEKESSAPLSAIRVLLEPAAGMPVTTGLPQLYSAQLRVRAVLWGSSPWLALWPLSSFLWVMSAVGCLQLCGLCLCCRSFILPTLPLLFGSSRPDDEHSPEEDGFEPVVGLPVSGFQSSPLALSRTHAAASSLSASPLGPMPARWESTPSLRQRNVGALPPAESFSPGAALAARSHVSGRGLVPSDSADWASSSRPRTEQAGRSMGDPTDWMSVVGPAYGASAQAALREARMGAGQNGVVGRAGGRSGVVLRGEAAADEDEAVGGTGQGGGGGASLEELEEDEEAVEILNRAKEVLGKGEGAMAEGSGSVGSVQVDPPPRRGVSEAASAAEITSEVPPGGGFGESALAAGLRRRRGIGAGLSRVEAGGSAYQQSGGGGGGTEEGEERRGPAENGAAVGASGGGVGMVSEGEEAERDPGSWLLAAPGGAECDDTH